MQLGIEALLEAGGYGAYSTHFDAIGEDGRFNRLPLAAALATKTPLQLADDLAYGLCLWQ